MFTSAESFFFGENIYTSLSPCQGAQSVLPELGRNLWHLANYLQVNGPFHLMLQTVFRQKEPISGEHLLCTMQHEILQTLFSSEF